MRRSILLFITSVISWLVIIYTNLFLAINAPKQNISNDYSLSSIPVGSRWVDEGYSDDGKDHSPWRLKVWKWREFLACESISLDIHDVNAYNYVRFDGSSIEMSLLTMPEMDYVYVAGISIGDVWGDGGNSNLYQLEPLKVAMLDRLTLDLNIHEFRGAPLSPFILPSWYALLTDLWFRIKNVTIEDASGVKRYEEKVLGIDIFHRTMGGGLNILVMGMKDEYSRIEPCNKNFIYSINLPSSTTSIDILALLKDVQEEARSKGWYFNMDDVELVMVETVLESYWSYTYARVEPPVIVYSKRVD